MILYRAYKWYSYKRYPILFRIFHNPYKFSHLQFVYWKFISSSLYRYIMIKYEKHKYNQIKGTWRESNYLRLR